MNSSFLRGRRAFKIIDCKNEFYTNRKHWVYNQHEITKIIILYKSEYL